MDKGSSRKIRIFVASPSDVVSERAKLETVIETLKPISDYLGLTLQVLIWRDVVSNAGRPQQIIFNQLKPTEWDIFIGILWHRSGTPSGATNPQTGKPFVSGTEEEFVTSYDLWRQHGKPRIVMYRCTRPFPYDVDPDQLKQVNDFFKLIQNPTSDYRLLSQNFDTTESFEKLLLDHLQKILIEYSEQSRTPITSEVVQVNTSETTGDIQIVINEDNIGSDLNVRNINQPSILQDTASNSKEVVAPKVSPAAKEEKPVDGNKAIIETFVPKKREAIFEEKKPIVETPKQEEKPIEAKKTTKGLLATKVQEKSGSTENKPVIEILNPILAEHPTPEWITANKITLSNGMEFMRVPAGKFVMGSNKDDEGDDEKPQHIVDIPYDYWMARYPVTNALYNSYVKAEGINHSVSHWKKSGWIKNNHPVVNLYSNEGTTYCKWLSNLLKAELPLKLTLRLPTEAEWEKAVRGTDGREFPWGNIFDKRKCNSGEGARLSAITTTRVGLFSPQGDSLFGCADMSGNVWEWTHSLRMKYPYNATDGRELKPAPPYRYDVVARVGSFHESSYFLRCEKRFVCFTSDWIKYFGFRVCIAPPIPE